jgi:cytochrome P450
MMVEMIARLVAGWEERLAAEGKLEFEVGEAMNALTMNLISRTMFGCEVGPLAPELTKAVAILSEVSVSEMASPFVLPDWMPLPGKAEKRWAMQILDETIRGFVRERRTSGEDRGDLLSMLLHAVDDDGGGGKMTDEQVRNEVMTMFMAGHDTTAAGLTWIWYNLARHDEVRAKVLAEIDRVLGGRPAGFEDVARLEYMGRVIDETLRLTPPAIGVFPRTNTVELEIGGYTIPAGSICRPSPTSRSATSGGSPTRSGSTPTASCRRPSMPGRSSHTSPSAAARGSALANGSRGWR